MTTRASSLDIARYCPLAPKLAAKYPGAGRSAFMSTAYHAIIANLPESRERYLRLTGSEQQQIETWSVPLDLELNGDPQRRPPGEVPPSLEPGTLNQSDAMRELAMGITEDLSYCNHGSPDAVIEGHADMVWIVGETAYVGDLKRSAFTTHGEVETPQLQAYGFMAMARFGVENFCVGIWAAEEGFWSWGKLHNAWDDETEDLWDALLVTATCDSEEPVFGPHCTHCYQRKHCPEWSVPVDDARNTLERLRQGTLLDPNEAMQVLLRVRQARDVADHAEEEVRAWIQQHHPDGIPDAVSKLTYRGRPRQGRESVSVKALREGLGEQAEQFIKRGKDTLYWSWGKR